MTTLRRWATTGVSWRRFMPSSQSMPEHPPQNTRDSLLDGLLRWLGFGLTLALVPLFAVAVGAVFSSQEHFHLSLLYAHGELLLLALTVLGAALSEMASQSRPRYRRSRVIVGGFALLVVLGSAVSYSEVVTRLADDAALDSRNVGIVSAWVFGAALVVALACLVIAGVEAQELPS